MTSGLIIYSRRGRRGGRGAAWKIERAWRWIGLAIDPGQEFQGLHGHSQTRVHNYRPRSALTLVLGLIINLLRGLISATRCRSFGDRTPRFRRYVLLNGTRSRPRRLRSTLFEPNISNVASSLSRAFCELFVPRETSWTCAIVAILNEPFLWRLPRQFSFERLKYKSVWKRIFSVLREAEFLFHLLIMWRTIFTWADQVQRSACIDRVNPDFSSWKFDRQSSLTIGKITFPCEWRNGWKTQNGPPIWGITRVVKTRLAPFSCQVFEIRFESFDRENSYLRSWPVIKRLRQLVNSSSTTATFAFWISALV